MNNLQALTEARAMLDDLNESRSRFEVNQLSTAWLGVDATSDDPAYLAGMRADLLDHIRTFCFDCGINCNYVGVPESCES